LSKKQRERKAFRMEREAVADQFYERVRQIVLSSDVSRMAAKLELRKEMMKDFKDKYEKAIYETFQIKLQNNVNLYLPSLIHIATNR
jgi:hypothetical protein